MQNWNAWGISWGAAWGAAWGQAVTPPVTSTANLMLLGVG